MSSGSSPSSISRKDCPIVCVPGAITQAWAIHGLTSVSPIPVTPSSVSMTTRNPSWADEVRLSSRLGASSTWQRTSVILMALILSTFHRQLLAAGEPCQRLVVELHPEPRRLGYEQHALIVEL